MTQGNSNPINQEIIDWLYDAYRERHPAEADVIKADYNILYDAMNGMPLEEMDKILYPVCILCTDHEKVAFCDGVRIGFKLAQNLNDKNNVSHMKHHTQYLMEDLPMNTNDNHIPYLMTIKNAAAYFGIGQKRLRCLAQKMGGEISVTSGNRLLIKRTELEAYIRTAKNI